MVAMARAVSLSPKEDSCDLEMKSDEKVRDSEIDPWARVNAEGGQRERSLSLSQGQLHQTNCLEESAASYGVLWTDVWDAMKCSGWTWKGGSGLMTDYYYIKPKCRIQGSLSGQDYLCASSRQLLRLARQYVNADILRRVILKDWGPRQALQRECTATPWHRRGEADAHRRSKCKTSQS